MYTGCGTALGKALSGTWRGQNATMLRTQEAGKKHVLTAEVGRKLFARRPVVVYGSRRKHDPILHHCSQSSSMLSKLVRLLVTAVVPIVAEQVLSRDGGITYNCPTFQTIDNAYYEYCKCKQLVGVLMTRSSDR